VEGKAIGGRERGEEVKKRKKKKKMI